MSTNIRKLLVGTDLSEDADTAVGIARSWAQRLGGSLVVAHATPDGSRSDMLFPQEHVAEAKAAISAQRTIAEELHSRLQPGDEVAMLSGKPGEVLLAAAKEQSADLIVLGGREPSGKRVFGSVAEYVLTHTEVPVLIARQHARTGRVVVAVDVDDDPDAPLAYASTLTEPPLCARLSVVHVPPKETPSIDREASIVLKKVRRKLPATTEFLIEHGEPAAAVVAVAERIDAELVVVGTHNRKGLARFIIGSVASAIARKASCSVLVVPLAK